MVAASEHVFFEVRLSCATKNGAFDRFSRRLRVSGGLLRARRDVFSRSSSHGAGRNFPAD
jgi:hypothetical protein